MATALAVESPSPIGDALYATDEIGGVLPHPADPAPSDAATRVRNWFIMARNHPIWATFIRNADEDEGFYIGGDLQWSKDGSFESLRRLQKARRTTVSLNYVQATVDALVGFERQNRYDLHATPEGNEDAESARILSWVMKFAANQAELPEYESEMFDDGLIRGAAALEVGVDWTEDPFNGTITAEPLRVGHEVIWDPHWKKYDLSDARFVLKYRWVYVDELLAKFPQHKAAIQAGVAILDTMFSPFMATTDGGRPDAYGSVSDHPEETLQVETLFYAPVDRRLLVIEAWWREFEPVWVVANLHTGKQLVVAGRAEAMEIVRIDPKSWRVIQKQARRVKTALILPATRQTLEEDDTPYDNDRENYPIVPFIAKKKGNYIYGIVRNMKDPQLVENKRVSQVLDVLARWANMRPMYAKGSLDDPRVLEDHTSTAAIAYNSVPGGGAPGWYAPAGLEAIVRGLIEAAAQMKMAMREITGVNTDLLGMKSDDASGIAIARRQSMGQVISTLYFDNFKRSRKIIGQRLARRIQQVYTTERVLRLIDPDTGDHVRVLLNPAEARHLMPDELEQWIEQRRDDTGRPYVLRDVAALTYDVTISESPSTPSARATALLSLLEIVGKMPSILPAVVDVILDLADIPDKPKILRRIRAIMQQQGINVDGGQAGGAGPGQPPGGGPPGQAVPASPSAPMPTQTASVPGIHPAAPPPGMPTAPTASMIPGRRSRPSSGLRRTVQASMGGAPVGAGP